MTTSFDATFTNNLERALASDEQLRDTLFGRAMAEALRALTGLPSFVGQQGIGGTDYDLFAMATKTRVWGLGITDISASPREFTIGAGGVFTMFGAEASTPDDSDFRLGLLITSEVVPIPAADNLWHLLECRVVNVDENDTRDILTNPVTREYTPQSVVKRKLKRLEFQTVAGTGSALPSPTAGWTPLYGFVNPTAGPALPVLSWIVDLRASSPVVFPRTENEEDGTFKGVTRVLSRRMSTFSSPSFPGSAQAVGFDLTAILDGQYLHAHTVDTTIDITDFLEGGGSPSGGDWYYVYLAASPIGGQCANAGWAAFTHTIVQNCQILLSATAPREDGRNSAALDCVSPFEGSTVAIGQAICVGVLLQASGAGGWEPQYTSQDGHVRVSSQLLEDDTVIAGLTGQAQGVTTAAMLPINVVRHVDLQFGMGVRTATQSAGGVGGLLLVNPCIGGVTAVNNEQAFGSLLINPLIQEAYQSISVPMPTPDHVSTVGTVDYKVETRNPNGVIYGVNGLLPQVCNGSAALRCRITGFNL